ncbi:MAG: glycosyltransferase family 25 protein [Gemmatimonadaceae bacterium]|nr:glycosyltransferase family 25 protein [Gemmatimonadaceae bacterium]
MFDATYVINLDRSVDRWAHAQRITALAGLPNVIRFSAVDGRALGAQGMESLQRRGVLSTDLSRFSAGCYEGEIGCAVSHALVLQDILERGWRTALVLEDDVELAGDPATWRARSEAAFRDLPRDWEAWYLYRCFDIEHRVRRLSPRTVVPWVPQGGAAYALSATGAAIFHKALTPVGDAVDRVYMDVVKARAIKAFAASPLLIDPGVQPSVINLDNPSKEWVEDGVNRPPEYWPVTHLAHLGESVPEAPPPLHTRAWQAGLRTFGRLLGRQDRTA